MRKNRRVLSLAFCLLSLSGGLFAERFPVPELKDTYNRKEVVGLIAHIDNMCNGIKLKLNEIDERVRRSDWNGAKPNALSALLDLYHTQKRILWQGTINSRLTERLFYDSLDGTIKRYNFDLYGDQDKIDNQTAWDYKKVTPKYHQLCSELFINPRRLSVDFILVTV